MKSETIMFIRIKVSILLILCLSSFTVFGQNQVRGHLKARDSIELSIINVLPDSFPTISIIFKGHKANGEPLWNLKKEDFKVTENGEDSNVKSLIPISRNKPINVGVVIDHSFSMTEDYSLLFDKSGKALFSYDTITFELILPKDYVSPIDNAKATTKEFINSFNFKKDFISIVGFSSTVDKILPLTNNKAKIDSIINSMQADSLTALYDAMLTGLNQLNTSNGVNVLVTLTDGQNNKSKSGWKDVTERAAQLEIPIYIIGLGNVNKDTLQMIADITNGRFIYTQTSESFREIYSRISKEIQSFYDLKYESRNLSAMESKRNLTITFRPNDNKSDTLNYDFMLPDEVKVYLKNRAKRLNYIIGTSIVSAVTLAIGTIVYRRRRRKNASR
jgi:Ca-activated chloride channel family protein